MRISYRIAAGSTALSLLLSATPAAALGLGVSANGEARVRTSEVHLDADTNAKVKTNVGLLKRADKNEVRVENSTDVRASVSTDILLRMKDRVLAFIKHGIQKAARISKAICNREEGETAVQACLDAAKADLKAKISAMIDVSFGA